MNPTTELEIVEPVEARLSEFARHAGLEISATTPLVSAFRPIFIDAKKVLLAASGVAESVKDATRVTEIKKARECRLAIRKVRLAGETARKAQKANALAYGKAVDGFYNILEADLTPVEQALQNAEDVAERAETARLDALETSRNALLSPFVGDVRLYQLRAMPEAAFTELLNNAKTAKESADAARAKAESDRIAAEKAAAAEAERIRSENVRLQAEKVAIEAAAKAEREASDKKLAAERAAAQKAAAEAEAKALADKLAAEAAAAQERAKIEAAAKAEREALEAKADKQRKEDAEKARKEREASDAKAAVERAAREKAEAELKAQRDAEAKRLADLETEAKKAASAGDAEKLLAFAKAIRSALPSFKDSERMTVVAWLEKEAEKL